jgi:hypothetical protein
MKKEAAVAMARGSNAIDPSPPTKRGGLQGSGGLVKGKLASVGFLKRTFYIVVRNVTVSGSKHNKFS